VGLADDHLIPLLDEGLGNSARLVGPGDGRTPTVDAGRGLRAACATDTHLHADPLSGALRLGHGRRATVLASVHGRHLTEGGAR
jgi:hypothetical protein